MNETIPESIEDHTWCISTAISDLHFGLNSGYMYYPEVFETLNESGMTKYAHHLSSLNVEFPNNLIDSNLLNNAIQRALSLKLDKSKKSFTKKQIIPISCTDIGLVDYYKNAFRLFGFKVSAPYNFFFVVLGLGIFFYIMAFLSRPIFLLLPLLLQGVILMLMKLQPLDPIFNYHYLPILAVIPTAHVLLSSIRSKLDDFKLKEGVLFVLQSFLICFVITTRSSGAWAVLAIGLLAILQIFYQLRCSQWKGARAYIPYFLVLLIPVLAVHFFSAYKTIMVFSNLGLSSIKQQHFYSSDLIISSLKLVFGFGLITYFCLVYRKKIGKKPFSISFVSFLALLFFLPLFFFYLRERPEQFKISNSLFKGFRCLILMGTLYLSFFVYKGIKEKSLSVSNINIFSKASFCGKPALLFLFLFLSHRAYQASQVHPAYSTNDVLPHHLVYHNAYMGFLYHPTIKEMLSKGRVGDSFSFLAGIEKFISEFETKGVKLSEKDYISVYTHTYKMGLHDRYMKKLYVSFILRHPILTLQAHLYKLETIFLLLKKFIQYKLKFYPYIFIGILFLLYNLKKRNLKFSKDLSDLSWAIFFMSLAATTPNLYAITHEVEDCQLVWLIGISIWALKFVTIFCFKENQNILQDQKNNVTS